MVSVDKIEELIDELHDLAVDGPSSPMYVDEITGELFKTIRAALHSVEAEKESQWRASGYQYPAAMSHNPDAKDWADFFMATFPNCGADPDIMLGWFANAMMAMHDHIVSEAEKELEWISCEDRLPTSDDEDWMGYVVGFSLTTGMSLHSARGICAAWKDYFVSYWTPTGLRRPAPPEHKPE